MSPHGRPGRNAMRHMNIERNAAEPIVSARGLSVRFPVGSAGLWGKRRSISAVDDVSFDIWAGETLGLVGESGSGKSTTGRAVLRRVELASGSIYFKGRDITHAAGEPLRRLRRHMQMVFQDP